MTTENRSCHPPQRNVPEVYLQLADRVAGVLSRLAVGGGQAPQPPEAPLPLDVDPAHLTARQRRQVQDNLRGSMSVLSRLVMNGGEASVAELREATGLSGARVSNICTSLEDKGLIERSHRDKDRRRVTVELTEAGRELAEEKMDFARLVIGDFLWDLGEEDSRELVALLDRVLTVIEKRHGRPLQASPERAASALFAIAPPPLGGPVPDSIPTGIDATAKERDPE